MAPPSTPAPSRFLPSRQQGQASQAGPTPGAGLASGASARQFITTPRFGPTSSTQQPGQQQQHRQPPPFSTPLASAGRRAFVSSARSRPPLPSDLIDSSPISPEDDASPPPSLRHHGARKRRSEPVEEGEDGDEILVDIPSQSSRYSSQQEESAALLPLGDDDDDDDDDGEEDAVAGQPALKRRRIAAFSEEVEIISSQPEEEDEEKDHNKISRSNYDVPGSELEEDDVMSQRSDHDANDFDQDADEEGGEDYEDKEAQNSDDDDDEDLMAKSADEDLVGHGLKPRPMIRPNRGRNRSLSLPQGKPTFHKAPRFKIAEPAPDGDAQFPLPEAFSPQRRGARYIPGGLAAEVRDWLFQVKGDERSAASVGDRSGGGGLGSALRGVAGVCVDEVSAAPGMRFVKARLALPDGEIPPPVAMHGGSEGDGEGMKIILAGDGRISGLGGGTGRAVVRGSRVAIHPPTWEVAIRGQGRWVMVCDWSVVDELA